ncbi:23S rRNA (pseudouridine(1915)-N(3))-methyltransferase RlmH [Candidatus Uhrbacteria bacterium CG_4_10_14_0_8_um_filter_58_22]|uniref:Ribosomal RNA large subunit methyltransferase H n=1 Tax=Candidatus Uhrbacteria bacterium CG_4_10_14_0_8_um_filter_58_22 TaxID=1975029 RepID=A0A2M7Q8X1_9BACT|nr:MAG: 23S rRNA (pseudouridine(1915)-N(3))-methyltransferase RlmH [Candidatus Uhrbacteria bacterium CG_4_10_14_0_8_um_filter_58_22]
MNLKIVCVGKMKEDHWSAAQAEYLKRLGPLCRVEVVEVSAERLGGGVTDAEAMRREGERLLKQVPDGAAVIVLDRTGRQLSSEGFADLLRDTGGTGRTVVFLIGGAAGLSPEVLAASERRLSLSEMTLPHELARVFLIEQLYRAMSILHGGKYHR